MRRDLGAERITGAPERRHVRASPSRNDVHGLTGIDGVAPEGAGE
jgi:hypothetical protein